MSEAFEQSDEDLAAAAKLGDADAFDVLVRRFMRPAMALAWQTARSVADAEDVVQESFHRMVRALPRYDAKRSFSAWFFTIVRNTGRSALSKGGRRQALVPTTEFDAKIGHDLRVVSPEVDVSGVADLRSAISRLAPMQKMCFGLCEVEGFTSVEAARMLDLTEGTVRTHLYRARRRLRRQLGVSEQAS